MAYATQKDIEQQYSEEAVLLVAEDPDNIGQVDTDKVNENLRSADGVIDGYLASRYDVPLVVVPDNLREMSVDIAMYRMSTDGTLTEDKRRRYEDAIASLRDVARGRASLPDAEAPTTVRTAPVVPGRVFGGDRVFTRTTQQGTR